MSVTRPCPGFEMERELCEQLSAVKCVHQEIGTMHTPESPAPLSARSGVDAPKVLVKHVHHSVELENCIEDQVAGEKRRQEVVTLAQQCSDCLYLKVIFEHL